jgi:cysteine desulfurase/selenocysteine lyase
MLDTAALRRPFPYLRASSQSGHPVIYLDNAATAQKPQVVIDALQAAYADGTGNVHRGMHELSERTTVAYEAARERVRKFLDAQNTEEIIFTRNATEAINLVVISLSRGGMFQKGDRVILSILEHHSNIVPWMQLKERKGIEILWIDCDEHGQLNMDQYEKFLHEGRVKMVSITGQSNVLGVRPELTKMITLAHAHGAKMLVDAAQLVAHGSINVSSLDCDFLAFSGHKVFGPTGIGVLYGKRELLEAMPPFLGGGMMIREVTTEGFTPADLPMKFEAGTPPAAEAIALHAAIDWMESMNRSEVEDHERALLTRAIEKLGTVEGLRILGPGDAAKIFGCVSFVIEGIHPHDLTHLLGERGIALRAGHHCTQPLHKRLGINASTRLSVAPYNTLEEIDHACTAIQDIVTFLRGTKE